jgi:hypothetical protein
MTVKTFTKTQIWDAREEGKTLTQLLEGLTFPPEDIQFIDDTFGIACKKWSQLIAWSWLDQKLFFSDDDLKLAELLQTEFKAAMAKQAQTNTPSGSKELESFLSDLQKRFEPLVSTLSLAQNLDTVFDKNFEYLFHLQVNDTFEGQISIDTEQEHNGKKPKITIGLAYPFDGADPSKNQLYLSWMNDTTSQEQPPAYLPTGTF